MGPVVAAIPVAGRGRDRPGTGGRAVASKPWFFNADRRLRSRAHRWAALPSFSMTSAAAGTSGLTPEQISAIDAAHLWHPYSTIGAEAVPPVVVVGARGARLTLIHDGGPVEVLDAMSSWWTAIHGHGHPVLDAGWP